MSVGVGGEVALLIEAFLADFRLSYIPTILALIPFKKGLFCRNMQSKVRRSAWSVPTMLT